MSALEQFDIRSSNFHTKLKLDSIAGYILLLGMSWEWAIVTSPFGLANGGTGGAIVSVLLDIRHPACDMEYNMKLTSLDLYLLIAKDMR